MIHKRDLATREYCAIHGFTTHSKHFHGGYAAGSKLVQASLTTQLEGDEPRPDARTCGLRSNMEFRT